MPRPVVELLQAHLECYVPGGEDAIVFTGPTGRPLRRSNFNKLVGWERARDALGVPHLHCMIYGILVTLWPPAHLARQHAI